MMYVMNGITTCIRTCNNTRRKYVASRALARAARYTSPHIGEAAVQELARRVVPYRAATQTKAKTAAAIAARTGARTAA